MTGGAMRAIPKLTPATGAAAGIRGFTAERLHLRAVSVNSSAATGSSGEEMKLVSSQSDAPSFEIEDRRYAGGEAETIPGGRELIPRVVFDRAPTLQEATEATSELVNAFEMLYQPSHDSVGASSSSNSAVEKAKDCVIGETRMTPAVPSPVFRAFRLLRESPAVQNVVASIASDQNVLTAAMQNRDFQEYLNLQRRGLALSHSDTDADRLDELSAKSTEDSSNDAESKPGISVSDFVQKIKAILVDMITNNMSGFFQKIFGGVGAKEFANGDESSRLSAERATESSLLGLAIMAIMLALLKRV